MTTSARIQVAFLPCSTCSCDLFVAIAAKREVSPAKPPPAPGQFGKFAARKQKPKKKGKSNGVTSSLLLALNWFFGGFTSKQMMTRKIQKTKMLRPRSARRV